MSNTTRHLIWGIGWFLSLPLVVIISIEAGYVPVSSPLVSVILSFLWTFGVIGVFLSWALKDAPSHGKSRYVALTFTVAWLLVLVFAVFPYLFATRGAKGGLLASLKFLSLLLVLGLFWVGAFRLSGALLG